MSSTDIVLTNISDGILTVSLNKPGRKNALSREMREQLATLWEAVASNVALRCVIVTGIGDFFSAGADVRELDEIKLDSAARHIAFTPVTVSIPVVLALNGPCIGGALRFITDADVVISSEDAWLSDPHINMGVQSERLTRDLINLSGPLAAAPLILGGSEFRMTSSQAQRAGLVSEVVETGELVQRTMELATIIASQPTTALKATVQLIREMRDHKQPGTTCS